MSLLRGWIGEKRTALKMWLYLDRTVYRRFHNVIIPSKNGTTQIDHLIVSNYGVFIVETKNKKGWIFGSEDQLNWTQTIFKNKYSFQNPLRQTYRQKKVLAEFLGMNTSIIHTVIYFVGDCEFKTPMPSNVIKSKLGRHIRKYRNQVLTDLEVDNLFGLIKHHISKSNLTRKDHLRSLKLRHKSNSICPKCGSALVRRKVKHGPDLGSLFLGCESYPKCRYTKNL